MFAKYSITIIITIVILINRNEVTAKISTVSHQQQRDKMGQNFPPNPADDCLLKRKINFDNFVKHPVVKMEQIPVSKLMTVGSDRFGDSFRSLDSSFPCWFDPELAREGQKFAIKNLAFIFVGHLLSLVMLLANDQARRVMVATKRSETPEKAFKRYTATVLQVKLWYEEDILSPDWIKSLINLRQIHEGVGHHLKSLADNNLTDFSRPLITKSSYNFRRRLGKSSFSPDEKMWTAFQADLTNSRLNLTRSKLDRLAPGRQAKEPYNQFLMSLTQWSFVAMPILFPQNLGIPQWTEEELKGFAHLWAVISFVLGTEEKFILCKNPNQEGLNNCKNYLTQIHQQYMIPPLFHIDFEARVMIEALLRSTEPLMGTGQPDYFLIELLEDILQIQAPHLNSQAGWQTRLARFGTNFFARAMSNWPILKNLMNFLVGGEIQLASQRNFGHPGTHPNSVAGSTFFFNKK